jgi:hypothetical protein
MDWMNCLKGEVSFLLELGTGSPAGSAGGELDGVQSMLEVLHGVLDKNQEAAAQLQVCKTLLETVKEETEVGGWPLLDAEYNCQAEAWKLLVAQCVEAKERVLAQSSMWHSCESALNDLTGWLRSIDLKVRVAVAVGMTLA